MENFFKLKENKTTVTTEIFAGLTTFMTMAYILIVNPDILSAAGMDRGAVFTATALAAGFGTLFMAILTNYPFALAPGMGLNAFFAFTVAAQFGWQIALLAILVEGVIFILLSFINVREAIFAAIPQNLKYAVTVGIGLFIAFIGLKNGGIIVSNEATSVAIGNMKSVSTILALIGTIISIVLLHYKVKGSLFFGILITYFLGIICQLVGIYVPNPEAGVYSLLPSAFISLPPSIKDINIFAAISHLDMSKFKLFEFAAVVFAFLFVDIFDTVATLIGVSEKAGFLDKDGKLPKVKKALIADAMGTIVGAIFGTSTNTTYIESAAGVAEGGRTGLTSVVVAGLFFISLIFSPIFSVIPSFATAPALIIVGLFMCESIVKIDFTDFTEGFPAFMGMIIMPLAYSISEGLIFAVLSYVILKVLCGKSKDLNPVMIVVAILFAIKLFM